MHIRKTACMKILSLVLLFITVSITSLTAQSGYHLTGQVVGEEKQLSLATVALLDKNNKQVVTASADSNGYFQLSYNIPGHYSLLVSHTGYKAYNSNVFPLSDKDFGKIKLVVAGKELEQVVVQAKPNLVELSGNNIVYNVSKSIDAQGISALEALKKAPGVSVNSDNSIMLNGRAGALITIDGKQTYLSGKEIADLLKTMPASEIKSIEIINSPTAKYDAAGTAGIINIKTLKSQIKGFNATVTTGLAYGVSFKQNLDLAFNYRKNKYNIYGAYNHFLGNYNYVYGFNRFQNNKGYVSATDDTDKRKKAGARIGVDYNIDKKNTIGILLNSNFVFGGGITYTRTDISDPDSGIVQRLTADNDYYFQQTDRYNANVNYKYEDASGRAINFDADYGHFKKDNSNLQSNIYTDKGDRILSQNLYRSLNGIRIDLKALKFDYTTPLAHGTFETGAKYSRIGSDNNANFYHVLGNKDSLDDRRSSTFRFNEQISSGYVNYKKEIGKWVVQAGVRVENTSATGILRFRANGKDSVQTIDRNYTNLFPSFSVSVKPRENHSFSLSYSRRIDRPAYQELNPFVYLLDELSYWQGNPFLQPQLSHRLSLQYVFKNATIISFNYAYTSQFSYRITDTLDVTKIVMIPRNLGVQKSVSFSATQNITPAKWWDITCNGTMFHIYNKVSFDSYRNLQLKQLAARINLQQRFKLPNAFIAEVSGYLNTKRLTGANEVSRGTSQVDIGLQRSFLKNKAIVRLAVNDIYKGTKARSVQSFDGFNMESYSYWETRQIRINFTYKFSDNSNVKGPRTRSSALENENGRIK
jgi:outer membrane receptor protein involved in Fe transport